MGLALRDEVREHLDGVEGSSGTLRMELDTPNLLARSVGGLDALDGGVVAVDEEGFPALGEGVLELQRVLVVLARDVYTTSLDGSR